MERISPSSDTNKAEFRREVVFQEVKEISLTQVRDHVDDLAAAVKTIERQLVVSNSTVFLQNADGTLAQELYPLRSQPFFSYQAARAGYWTSVMLSLGGYFCLLKTAKMKHRQIRNNKQEHNNENIVKR